MRDLLKILDLQVNPTFIKEETVGRKVATLKPLLVEEEDYIPTFFVITTAVFNKLHAKVAGYTVKDLAKVRQQILEYKFSAKFIENIEQAYRGLSKLSHTKVAIRATVSAPDFPYASFSGVFPTYLNVRGVSDILKFVKQAYASFFTESVFAYLSKNKIKPESVSLAIMVQKMVIPEVSGVAYLMDPITHTTDNVTIEAVYGIGDVIANGEVNPDIYFVNRETLQVIEKKINPQFWMRSFVNDPDPETGEYTVKIELAKIWHNTPKLTDEQIVSLSKIVTKLTEYYKDLTVEWVYSNGKFWVLQIKGIVLANESKKVKVGTKTKTVFPLITGLPLSYGEATGSVVVLNADLINRMNLEELVKYVNGKIIVSSRFFPILRDVVEKAKIGGVILDIGSPRSDGAFLLNELKIPAIGATFNASRILKDGQKVYLDAKSGAVYPV